jgi:hypothetical protein
MLAAQSFSPQLAQNRTCARILHENPELPAQNRTCARNLGQNLGILNQLSPFYAKNC